jgi:CubicO group peptidase (beta-lactamase class C family)
MELGIATAPPQPQLAPDPDTWIELLGTMPLLHQPGARWLYHYGSEVLGVLIARASGQPFERFLAERVFEPLRMRDTAFVASDPTRLTTCYTRNPETSAIECFDPPTGEWATMPAFPSGGGGLVSTIDDFFSFGRMLLAGGRLPDGSRLLSRSSVEAMTTDQIGAAPGGPGPSIDGSLGWGFGVGVQVRRIGLVPSVGGYGWTGGLGSAWGNDPTERLVGIVLTTDAFTSAFPLPATIQDFWTTVYAAFDD